MKVRQKEIYSHSTLSGLGFGAFLNFYSRSTLLGLRNEKPVLFYSSTYYTVI